MAEDFNNSVIIYIERKQNFLTLQSDLLISHFVLDGYTGFLASEKNYMMENPRITNYEFPYFIKDSTFNKFYGGTCNIRNEIGKHFIIFFRTKMV
ncbi:hypothetical protein U3516DRAFT_768289 [Neocallimastix sp. 'constans']